MRSPSTRHSHPLRRRIAFRACVAALLIAPAIFAQTDLPQQPSGSGPPTEVTVTDRGTVRMHVADMPISTVLHLLSLQSNKNIIASPKVTGKVTANLYDVTFEDALRAILVANGAAYRQVGRFIYVYTIDELADLDAAGSPDANTRVYRLNYISSSDAKNYLTPLVEEDTQIIASPAPSTGLTSKAEEGGGNSSAAQDFVVITAPPETHRKIRSLLAELDIRPKQVLIEATILRAELTDDNALGVDFTLVGGVDLELLGATSNGLADLTLGQLPQDRLERFNGAIATDFAGNVASGGMTIGIIKDKVGIFVRALEEVTDTTVLANPKILALNRQKGQVIVGRRDGFITTTVTQTQAIQTVKYLETGTQLIFRPFIGDDGFVRLELHPEDSVGFVNAQGLPSEQTTEVTTNVIVKDGETILIGGLFREVTTDARSQIPFFGNLPGIGQLFRSNTESTGREEVIILMTVHIVKDHQAYAAASAEQLENLERMRVGVRQGLMWHGRERLAQTHYGKAVEYWNQGNREKAIWHVNLAIHNNTRLLPAILLKEKILTERAWDDEGCGGRLFLHTIIAKEKGYALPMFGRPKTSPSDQTNPSAEN